ncbi:NUDIX hydrolase [Acidisoma cellulosilytica]|uniref:NUDIX hydrolase n=1 Tax=Acidisoma cellulosilyticum TaxID=2802395 RepID=A0A964E2V7_9PROT|nr:NUDIX hydrolase [Acidisoma cellulosilyticum]MCB8879719.1 NUDIX hydrolase [Acidisoma cellulosilyticum]
MAEPDWLLWAREIQATAQTGLAFTKDPYDRDRYEALRALAARMLAARTDGSAEGYAALFAAERGYTTPKIDVRGAVFDAAGRILMVREVMDHNRWTLPGGWADVSQTTAQSAVREVFEETGYTARAVKLVAVWDYATQRHPWPSLHSIAKHFFLCEITGGAAQTSLETSEIRFFAEDDIPADLSLGRVLPRQIARMFAHWRDRTLPTEFD